MERYIVEKKNDKFILKEEQVHQIVKVMRNRIGDKITLVHDGIFSICEIVSLNPLDFLVIEENKCTTELNRDITLLYCLPKGDKLEFAVQKATEIGAKKIVLVNSSRTIMKIKKEDEKRKLERYSRIALEASEQCSRAIVPTIEGVIPFTKIDQYASSLNLIAYENERSLKIDNNLLSGHDSVSIVIGAEGGFSKDEVDYASSKGFKPVCLGNRILRSETAVVYALTLLSHYSED